MTALVTDQLTEGMQLDSRQRAMLQAMGITLWEPEFYAPKQALAQENNAQIAINNIAKRGVAEVTVPVAAPAVRAWAPAPVPEIAPRAATPSTVSAASSVTLQPLPEGIAQMDWLQLQTAVSSCRACGLCESRNNTVFGVGQASTEPALAPRADWLIVGEAPGENEDIQGEPFVGQAGKLLDNMLRAMVIDGKPLGRHSNVFIANVLKCRPPANRNPSPAEVAQCQPYLLRQIELLQPKIILAMGRFAVQSLLGSTEPLGKLRGRVHQMPTVPAPVIVTYHPAYLLRNLPDKAKAWADLMLAMETLQAASS
jgi:uracil-DNA glycosylase